MLRAVVIYEHGVLRHHGLRAQTVAGCSKRRCAWHSAERGSLRTLQIGQMTDFFIFDTPSSFFEPDFCIAFCFSAFFFCDCSFCRPRAILEPVGSGGRVLRMK